MSEFYIEIEDHGWWTAKVTGYNNMDISPAKCFYSFSHKRARHKAERWCRLKEKRDRESYERRLKARKYYFDPTLDSR